MNVHGSLEEGNSPLVSIIVPVYNVMSYLPRCVETLKGQTYRNIEILLVDDGSTDGTSALCDRLEKTDSRIRVFHKQNGGTSSARNLGISKAQGEYLGFVDSDDYTEKDMYERLMSAVLRYGTKAAQIGRDELDALGNRMPDICVPPQEAGIISQKDFLRELLMHRGDCSFCTKLISRECFEGRGFPEGVLNEDFRLLIEMLQEMGPIVSLPGYAYHVCYRPDSNTRKVGKEAFSRVYGDSVDNADLVYELVKRGYPAAEGSCPAVKERYSAMEETAVKSLAAGEGRAEGTISRESIEADPDMVAVAFRFGVFQRLEYLLHIPIAQMRKGNTQYREIVRWLRRNFFRAVGNPYLTLKNKVYHLLFAAAPKGIRVAHRWIKRV